MLSKVEVSTVGAELRMHPRVERILAKWCSDVDQDVASAWRSWLQWMYSSLEVIIEAKRLVGPWLDLSFMNWKPFLSTDTPYNKPIYHIIPRQVVKTSAVFIPFRFDRVIQHLLRDVRHESHGIPIVPD